jgi:hypothetical protein
MSPFQATCRRNLGLEQPSVGPTTKLSLTDDSQARVGLLALDESISAFEPEYRPGQGVAARKGGGSVKRTNMGRK